MRNKLIIDSKGNIAVFEFDPIENNSDLFFDLTPDGVLFITGYHTNIMEHEIGTAKRYVLPLKDFTAIGLIGEATKIIEGDFSPILKDVNIDNCLIMLKTNLMEPE